MKLFLFVIALLQISLCQGAEGDLEALLSAQSKESQALGKKHYTNYCSSCHAPQNIMVSSPKPGDKNDWSQRIQNAGGFQGLIKNAMKGKGAMPEKGLCKECKKTDLESAVLYMIRGF